MAHVLKQRGASSDFDDHLAVVAWPPFVRVVEGVYAHGVDHALRREDIVELGLSRRFKGLLVRQVLCFRLYGSERTSRSWN